MRKEIKPLILLVGIFLVFSIFFFAKCANPIIDFSREAYIPYKMLSGSVLVKDIFLIYGSFGYILNSLIFKIFGANFNFLFLEANLISFLFLITFYFISRSYLNIKETVLFSFCYVSVNIFSTATFSFATPYSFSTLWGYFGAYLSYLCFLKKKSALGFFFLGFVLINKIELGAILLFSIFIFQLLKKNFSIKNALYALIFPILNSFYFVLNKVTLADFSNNLFYLKKMVNTNAIKTFYFHVGVYFNKEYYIFNLKMLLFLALALFVSYLLFKKGFKAFSIFSFFFFCALFFVSKATNLAILFLLYPLVFLIFKKKKLKEEDILLLIFTICLNLKAIFCINTFNYSNFGFILVFFAIYVFYKKIFPFSLKKWLFGVSLVVILFLNFFNIQNFIMQNKILENNKKGTLYLSKNDGNKLLFEFLNKSLKKDDTFLVVPEGLIFNFIFEKPYPYYYSTFTPLDFETFSESRIIKDVSKYEPNYIIFYPRNTREYGAETICYDYAINFCTYIMENYSRVGIIEDEKKILIFRRKQK